MKIKRKENKKEKTEEEVKLFFHCLLLLAQPTPFGTAYSFCSYPMMLHFYYLFTRSLNKKGLYYRRCIEKKLKYVIRLGVSCL
jgi:hypothetical protein